MSQGTQRSDVAKFLLAISIILFGWDLCLIVGQCAAWLRFGYAPFASFMELWSRFGLGTPHSGWVGVDQILQAVLHQPTWLILTISAGLFWWLGGGLSDAHLAPAPAEGASPSGRDGAGMAPDRRRPAPRAIFDLSKPGSTATTQLQGRHHG